MAERNSRGILKFNNGEGQKLLKLNYSVSRATDVSGRVASDPSMLLSKLRWKLRINQTSWKVY